MQEQAQELAEARDSTLCHFRVLVHERSDCMQRVEQEMRVELHPESLKLSLDQLRLQLRGLYQTGLVALVINKSVFQQQPTA